MFSELFSCFPFSFMIAENNAIKRNVKSRLRKKSNIKENLLRMRRQDLLKPICNRPSQKLSALICFALQEILKLTAHYSISFLNCQKWVTNHSDQILPFPQGATESMPRSKRNCTAFECSTQNYSFEGTYMFYFCFYKLWLPWKRSCIRV